MRNVIMLLLFVGVIGGLFALNQATRTKNGESVLHIASEVAIDVETTDPQQVEIIRTVEAPGEVEAYDEVDISSELVSKIIEMPVGSGSVVEKDDLLCKLDDADFRARLLSAEANVAKLEAMVRQANADFEKSERDLQRQIRLSERDSTSPRELADTQTLHIGAEAVLEMRHQELIEAQALLQSAQEDLEKTVIRAPIAGTVSQLFAQQGEVVVTGTMNNPGTRIMVVSDLSKMIVRCRVDEGDAALVKPDQPARIYLQSNTRRSIPGRVTSIATKGIKPTGRDVVTFEALVLITELDERVKPGMSANVEIEVDRRPNALTVPVESVVYRKRRDLPKDLVNTFENAAEETDEEETALAQYLKLIFSVEDGKAKACLVETGISDAQRVEIVRGISASDRIVNGPYRSLDQLADGSKVKEKAKPDAESNADDRSDTGDEALADKNDQPEAQKPKEKSEASDVRASAE